MEPSHQSKEKAGVVVYRDEPGQEPRVLVITSRKFQGNWVFPVGTVEKNESLQAAAKRECAEEAGYWVDVGSRLEPVEVFEGDKAQRFTFFLATIVDEAPAREMDRTRDWLPLSEVTDVVTDVFRSVAREAVQRLTQMNLDMADK